MGRYRVIRCAGLDKVTIDLKEMKAAATEIFCVSSGGAACNVKVQGDVLGQVLLMAGITFSL